MRRVIVFVLTALVIAPLPLTGDGIDELEAADGPLGARVARAQGTLPPLPAGWPSTLQLGWMSDPGDAAAMKATAPFGFRYQYLAGGVNTGPNGENRGWASWNPDGQFATAYIRESAQHGITPVFVYYQVRQSAPGRTAGDDGAAVQANLQDTATMRALFNDLKLLFQRAGAEDGRVVVNFEPDMWGFTQQRATGDNAATVPSRVAATGLPELAGLPDTAAGVARAAVRLRDSYAPNALLGYHISIWGTGNDIALSDPPDAQLDALGARAADFYNSLGANFDLAFAEFSDRDSVFKQAQYGQGPEAWWDAEDFRRHARFLGKFSSLARKRIAIWQIPLGNTRMRAMNNTWGHYQDNRVEWLLDEPARTHLDAYRQAGVVALMFGQGAGGATCACDAIGDGVTNPAPINGNARDSLNADDDGGFFRDRAKAYYAQGPLPLDSGAGPTPSPTVPPVPAPAPLSCNPRPRVVVTATPAGSGRLHVTIAAGSGTLSAVRVGAATNAVIDAGGRIGLGANTSLPVSAGAPQTTFVVRRAAPGQSTTVPLVVIDGCGDWPTLVGGGPTGF